jgi:short-subunit dehydrogenase
MQKNYGPWAFIAGGSEGIGAEISQRLADRGINIFLVARNEGALNAQRDHLQANYPVEVRASIVDLSQPQAVETIKALTADLDIGFYAHVASTATLGPYLDASEEQHHRALQVNVIALHELTYHFAARMKARGCGGIILCSSMASLSAFPYNAQYAAAKAYIRLLGEALWYELAEFKVDVLSLVISEVSTPALLRSGSELQGGSKTLTPQQVADEAFAALGKQPSLITGRRNRLTAFIARHFIPKKMMMKILAGEIARYRDPPDVH